MRNYLCLVRSSSKGHSLELSWQMESLFDAEVTDIATRGWECERTGLTTNVTASQCQTKVGLSVPTNMAIHFTTKRAARRLKRLSRYPQITTHQVTVEVFPRVLCLLLPPRPTSEMGQADKHVSGGIAMFVKGRELFVRALRYIGEH